VVLYLLDNSCFRAINENGDLVAITRLEEDGLFHVLGDLAVTPFSLLRNSLQELDRLIAACGNRHILILGALPCFFLKTCCDNLSHCANISRHDETQVEAGKKFMQDLEDLNSQLAARLNSLNVQFVFTGNVISGKNRCSIGDLAECLFTCWRSDPVHGDRSAYMKIAVGILDSSGHRLATPSMTADLPSANGPERTPARPSPVPWTVTTWAVAGRPIPMREERTSGPAQPTTATRADSAVAVEGEVVAVAAASTERRSTRGRLTGNDAR
jgi:hypothetical protein